QPKTSTAKLESSKNKFHISFDIAKSDQKDFTRVLEKLNLPENVRDGFEFELDATSSAKLSFIAPVRAKIDIADKNIKFRGQIENQFLKSASMEDFKFPKSTNMALFMPQVSGILANNFDFPDRFKQWLEKNLISKGQYFAVFGQDSQFAAIFKNDS